MSRERIDEMKKFIQLAEGTWSLPESEQDYKELAELLFGAGPKMPASLMKAKINRLYGDDELFDMLDELESFGDSSDVRPNVIHWIKNNDPATYKNLYSIGKAQTFESTVSEDFRSTSFNPKHMAAQNKAAKKRDLAPMKTMAPKPAPRPPRETGPSDSVIGQIMMDAITNVVPDGDPMDWLLPKLAKLGIREFDAMHRLDRAARSLGYADYHDALDSVMSEYQSQNPVQESADTDLEETFFAIVGDDNSNLAVVMLDKSESSYWYESTVYGNGPDNFGGKRYMGYLSPEDIIGWLNRDYNIVIGPYADEHEALMEMERMQEPADDDEIFEEGVDLQKIVHSVLFEGEYGITSVAEKKKLPKKFVRFSRQETEEVDESEINRIIDVGDAEDFEYNDEPVDPNHLGINVDLDEY